MNPDHLQPPPPRTPLYPLIQQQVAEAARPVAERLEAWRMMNARGSLRTTRFDGKPVTMGGVMFEGTPRLVFWGDFFEPFMLDAARQSLEWVVETCRDRHLDLTEYLAETTALLDQLVAETYQEMARSDQLLRGRGYPDSVAPVPVVQKVETMNRIIRDLAVALIHRGNASASSGDNRPDDRLRLIGQGGRRVMFDDIVLEDAQRTLLSQVVEVERSLPREARGRFILAEATGDESQDTFIHEGGPRLEGHLEDVEILADVRLVKIGHNSQGTPNFFVTPRGFQYYEHMKRAGAPDETVQEEIRRYIVSDRFRAEHAGSFAKWSQAENLLWSSDSKKQLTMVGHLCREATQEFADEMLRIYSVAEPHSPKPQTVRRLQAAIASRSSSVGSSVTAVLKALIEYWGTVADLAQRQEHGAEREGDELYWEDARRLVFQTLVVLYEMHWAMSRTR
jgi:hypothetical protein